MRGRYPWGAAAVLSLILAVALAGGACRAQATRTLTDLTEAEWAEAVRIAMDTPQARSQLEQNSPYETQRGWVGIVWQDSHAAELWGLDYETSETGIPTEVPASAVFYPQVSLLFGDPQSLLIRVAIDLAAGKAVNVEEHPLKRLLPTTVP
jgi:hypothetical protein